MGAAAHRHYHPAGNTQPALLDDGDVALGAAHNLVDRWAEHRAARIPALSTGAAPAEQDQVGLLLGGELNNALRGSATDAHGGAGVRTVGHGLEDPLQQSAGLSRPDGTLRSRCPRASPPLARPAPGAGWPPMNARPCRSTSASV